MVAPHLATSARVRPFPSRSREKPTVDEWAARLDLTRRGGEWCGPCPVCGGTDRFHVSRRRGGDALVGCRGCIDWQPKGVREQQFGQLLRTVFPERFDAKHTTGHSSSRYPTMARHEMKVRTAPAPESASDEDSRRRFARDLWAASATADDSPGRVYLAGRRAWFPSETGAGLPAFVRWLAADAAPNSNPALRWYGFPYNACGALVFAWRAPGVGDDAPLQAVSLEALTAAGERLPKRWRKTHGVRKGSVFTVPGNLASPVLAIVEGEVDALAVARASLDGLYGFQDIGEVRAVGSAGAFKPEAAADVRGREVLFLPDGPNRKGEATAAANAAQAAAVLRAGGRRVRVEIRTDGDTDIADDVREAVIGREAIQHG